jgi:SAM-dependent methyltransferase
MEAVHKARRLDPAIFDRPELAGLDERCIEYPVALEAVMQAAKNPDLHLLDVGCVLNNGLIAKYVSEFARMIWFINPSLEKPAYTENMVYVLSDIRRVRLPEMLQFDLVTCLSTIEHIGMDNTRYGGAPAEFDGAIDDPERFAIDGLRSISRFVKPGGRLLTSVPFGPFELLYLYQQPGRPIYYTFDKPRLLRLANALDGFEFTTLVYKVIPGRGWVKTNVDDTDVLPHAERCAAAGAVAFIDAVRGR